MKLTKRQHNILGVLLYHVINRGDMLDIYDIEDESPLDQALNDWLDGEPTCCCPRARRVITALVLDPKQYGFKPKSRRLLDKLVFKECAATDAKITEALNHMEGVELRRSSAQGRPSPRGAK